MTNALSAYLAGRAAAIAEISAGITTSKHFTDARREHLATRSAAGLFDFSFMGCYEIGGSDSRPFLRVVQTRALQTLAVGRIAYTLMLRDDGSVLNDATVWRLAQDRYWLFSGRRSDFASVSAMASPYAVTVTDVSSQHSVIAVQGPRSHAIVARCIDAPGLPPLFYYGFSAIRINEVQCWLARIGYSGETGYELVVPAAHAAETWALLLSHGETDGLLECGLDAMDSLRIEAGHILFMREVAALTDPFELGLGRLLDFYPPDFRGAIALVGRRWQAPSRRLVGLLLERLVETVNLPDLIYDGSAAVTSACWSPTLERNLGLGFVNACDAHPGTVVKLAGDERALVARRPFYDPAKSLPRRPLQFT